MNLPFANLSESEKARPMRGVLGVLLALGLGLASEWVEGQERPVNPVRRISLDEAYQSARARTETEALQASEVEQSRQRLTQARAGILPSLELNGTYTRQQMPPATALNPFSRADQHQVRLTLSQPVFRGLREFAALDVAHAGWQGEQARLRQARRTLYATVAQAFYRLAQAEVDFSNLEELLQVSRRRAEDVRGRVRIGRSRPGDLLAAETQVATVEAQLQAAQVTWEQSRDQFALTTGQPREVAPALPSVREPLPSVLVPLENHLSRLEQRPDVEAAHQALRSAERGVDVAWGAHLPSIDAAGNWYLERTGILASTQWDVSVTASMPVFQGGLVRSQVREAAQRRSTGELLLSQTRRAAEEEVRSAWLEAQGALQQIQLLERAHRLSEKNYQQQSEDYRLGLVSSLEVLSALNSHQDLKRSLDRARLQARLSLATLRVAVEDAP